MLVIPSLVVLAASLGVGTSFFSWYYSRIPVWAKPGSGAMLLPDDPAVPGFLKTVCVAHANRAGPLDLSLADVDLYDILSIERTRERPVRYRVGGVMVHEEQLAAAIRETQKRTFVSACAKSDQAAEAATGAGFRSCSEDDKRLKTAASVLLDTVERGWYNQYIVPLVDEHRDARDKPLTLYARLMPKLRIEPGGAMVRRSQTGKFEKICGR